MRRKSAPAEVRTSDATARLLATVDSESRPYTDPAANYPRAQQYRRIVAGQPRQEDT